MTNEVTRRVSGGKLSTIRIGDRVETMFFADDPNHPGFDGVTVGVSVLPSTDSIARTHYDAYIATPEAFSGVTQ